MYRNILSAYRRFDDAALGVARRFGLTMLRVTVGIVFIWFGALKLVPGLSPAEHLIRESITFLPMNLFLPFLACWEMAIGVGFVTGKFQRLTIALMLMQMVGAMSPLVLRPDLIWKTFPYVWTLEGQYVFKDIILVSAALTVGAALRPIKVERKAPVTPVVPDASAKRVSLGLKRATQQ